MPKAKCVFNTDLQKIYPYMTSTGPENNQVKCGICQSLISVANKGKYDLEQHVKSDRHLKALRSASMSNKIQNYACKVDLTVDRKTSAAEGVMAFHTVKHHHSFRSSDCTSKLIPEIFEDSKVAKKFTSCRTKTSSIVTNVLSSFCFDEVINELNDIPFISVATDASNHKSIKLFPLLVQYFTAHDGITTKLLKVETLSNERAETISNYILERLNDFGLKPKIIAFSGDNCNTNFGGLNRNGNNNVFALLKQNLGREIEGCGCTGHISHNSAKHALDMLPFDVEVFVIKLYNYFSIYTIRTDDLSEFCDFFEIEFKSLLRHVSFPSTFKLYF
jgi:hypothetical protein